MGNSLKGAVVMITGGSQGIGAACADEFRRRGGKLSIIDIQSSDTQSSETIWTTGDICDPKVRESAVARTLDAFGRIDILVNNAGVGLYEPVSRARVPAVRRIFDVNCVAAIALTGLVVPHLGRNASIVNVSSIGALVALPWCGIYCASKAAFHSFSRALQHDLREEGIHVMTVIPGIVDTRFREHVIAGEIPRSVRNLKRVISPQALAAAIADGVMKRRSRLVMPSIGFLFYWIEQLFPSVMNVYLSRLQGPASDLRDPAGATRDRDYYQTGVDRAG